MGEKAFDCYSGVAGDLKQHRVESERWKTYWLAKSTNKPGCRQGFPSYSLFEFRILQVHYSLVDSINRHFLYLFCIVNLARKKKRTKTKQGNIVETVTVFIYQCLAFICIQVFFFFGGKFACKSEARITELSASAK